MTQQPPLSSASFGDLPAPVRLGTEMSSYLQSLNIHSTQAPMQHMETQKKYVTSLPATAVQEGDVAAVAHFMVECFQGDVGGAEDFLLSIMNKLSIDRSEEKLASKTLKQKRYSESAHVIASRSNVRIFNDEIDAAISTLVLKVPGKPHIIGHVIGKGGSEISKIEGETGSTVKIDSQSKMLPGSTERRVCIIGTVSGNMLAQQLISKKIAEKLLLEDVVHDSLKMVVPDKAIRHIIGKGGASIHQLEADSGAQIQIDPETVMQPADVGRCITIHGSDSGRSIAQYLISRQVAQDETIDADWASNLGDSNSEASSSSSPWPTAQNQPHSQKKKKKNVESVTITVPNASVAYLIGRGGAAISDMQKQSRARINIAKQSAHAEMTKRRQVTISGTSQAIQLAQMIISRKLQQYEQGTKGGNSGASSPSSVNSNPAKNLFGSVPMPLSDPLAAATFSDRTSTPRSPASLATYSGDAQTDGGGEQVSFADFSSPPSWSTDQFEFSSQSSPWHFSLPLR